MKFHIIRYFKPQLLDSEIIIYFSIYIHVVYKLACLFCCFLSWMSLALRSNLPSPLRGADFSATCCCFIAWTSGLGIMVRGLHEPSSGKTVRTQQCYYHSQNITHLLQHFTYNPGVCVDKIVLIFESSLKSLQAIKHHEMLSPMTPSAT